RSVNVRNQLTPAAKESNNYGVLKLGIEDIQKAIAFGDASAEIHLDAARLCALAARVDPAWAATSISHLQDFVRRGGDPALCKDVDFKLLPDQATLQKLAAHPYARQPIPPTRRLVDPIKN